MPRLLLVFTTLLLLLTPPLFAKEHSALFPGHLARKARENCERSEWAAQVRKQRVEAARPFREMSDDDLWGLPFGNTLPRSWMVWSDGYCPACKQPVPMYNWKMDALGHPWKTECPHCQEFFPKNDFGSFYRSGLDDSGIFDPSKADRSLLFNTEHPDPGDPLHSFGVDDGQGYSEGEHTWRFVAAYLIYGQWKQLVLGGIQALSEAYVLTGDTVYARKAAILLDRVADLYPTFNFKEQGILYEGPGSDGYVSVWHDTCEETRELALAYDQVYEALEGDRELVAFLSAKAGQHGLENTKDSIEKIRANIEARILRDALAQPEKIYSNYPRREIAQIVIHTVLDWPENREEVFALMDQAIDQATAVDGVTGEKGLANYSAFVIQALAGFLGLYERLDEAFLSALIARNPRLKETWRFHIDTWCGEKYYPLSGDTGWFAQPIETYAGVLFTTQPGLNASMFTFLQSLSQATADPAYTQALYLANGSKVEGLPYDLFEEEADRFQQGVQAAIDRLGSHPAVSSIDKREWHLALLRSGTGESSRTLWIDYDSGGGHGHQDGMNIGLFAKGLDLLPDFGYPPVQFGGWGGEKSSWYHGSFSHNTVTVDEKPLRDAAGQTTFWAVGPEAQAVRCEAPGLIGKATDGRLRFERNLILVNIDSEDSYLLDVIRVRGGHQHTRHLHSTFGTVETAGLNLAATSETRGTVQRNFRWDAHPAPGWSVDWKIEDRYRLLPEGTQVGFRVTDFTPDSTVLLGESWVVPGGYSSTEEAWIPHLEVRRSAPADGPVLESTFVCLMEPYNQDSKIERVGGLQGSPDTEVTVLVEWTDGTTDTLTVPEGEMQVRRRFQDGRERVLEWEVRAER